MFSRRWTWIVLAAWLLVTGWFVVRDLGPRWRAAEPAPFAIAIGDEPRLSLSGMPRPRPVEVLWQISRNGEYRPGSTSNTRVQYNQWNDTLEFVNEFKMRDSPRRTGTSWLEVESAFRVDWEGRLLGFDAELRVRREPLLLTNPALVGRFVGAWLPGLTEHVPQWPFLRVQPAYPGGAVVGPAVTVPGLFTYDWPFAFRLPGQQWQRQAPEPAARQVPSLSPSHGLGRRGPPPGSRVFADAPVALYTDTEVAVRCRGAVRNNQFLAQWRISGEQREPMWNPTALSPRGHVLLPFHPLNRLPGLQAGQRWPVPLIDLEAALNLDRNREVRTVLAEVRDTEPLEWHLKRTPVFLVTYRDGDQEVARAWVRQSDFLVLRQELTFSSDRYTLERQQER